MRMNPFCRSFVIPAVLLAALPAAANATPAEGPATPAGREALAILEEAVAIPTVAGRGQVPVLAGKLRERLRRPAALRLVNRLGGSFLIGAGLLTAAVRRQA